MKALGMIGFVLSVLLLLLALYLQFVAVPAVEIADAMYIEGGGDLQAALSVSAREGMMNMANTVLLGGALSLILSAVSFLKTKNKLALAGAVLSLVSVLIGLIHGTHMFS